MRPTDPVAGQDLRAVSGALRSTRFAFARPLQVSGFRSQVSSRGGAAFTLVEILLVLAMMAMASAVLIPAAGVFFRRAQQENPNDLVAEVLQDARRAAILSGKPVALRFEAGTQRFIWDGGSRAAGEAKLRVDFLRPVATGAVLIAGNLVETGALDQLTFYPDGTCDPVRVQIRPPSGPAQVLSIDPWTCAPGLEVAS
jgi:type II secretory pathway pseudopilin PulG